VGLFRDLLDAFSQDVGKTRYADFAELADYCRRSANPVGRLLLRLYKADTPANLELSDKICTACSSSTSGRTWKSTGASSASTSPGRHGALRRHRGRIAAGEVTRSFRR
jgi:hypothetical protein